MYKPGWLLFCSLLLACLCQGAGAMSMDEACAAIPHPRPDFNHHDTGITSEEAVCLDALFERVNTAIVLKVEALNRLAGNGREGSSPAEYQANKENRNTFYNHLCALDFIQGAKG